MDLKFGLISAPNQYL